ncbi:hypothetical protein GCM10022246_15390 [Pedobacter ginsengiterrae]|uniref:TIR domain-containing protein n=1 Tax=Pedobacter ginsengiterrae TaxID=871696 RepID=A0ABP7PBW8_9SPHI
MAKIYISYSHADIQRVGRLTDALRSLGHEIVMDSEVMKVGVDFRKSLLNALKAADGALVYITENSLKSNYVLSEIGAARAFVDESDNKKFLIPVIEQGINIPNILQDLYCVRLTDDNFETSVLLIDQSISSSYGRKEAVEEKENIQREKIESTAGDYIDFALSELKKRESKNSVIANIWYVIGFLTLACGIIFALCGLKDLEQIKAENYWLYVLIILKSIIIVGLLIACSKYAFDLGKTHMNEALRNADRTHAISFGKFYLQAFSDRINSPEEIKDIFQNWNIDKDSAFQKLDANNFDPKFVEKLIDTVSSLAKKE